MDLNLLVKYARGKLHSGEPMNIKLESTAKVTELKTAIKIISGVPECHQYLSFDGYELADNRCLSDSNILNNSIITMVVSESENKWNSYPIYIKLLNGEQHTIEITSTLTVLQIKRLIEKQIGVPLEEQRLIFAGKQIEDDRIFCHYGIQRESTVHLVIRK